MASDLPCRAGRRGARASRSGGGTVLFGEALGTGHLALRVHAAHRLHRLGRGARLVAGRANGDVHSRRRVLLQRRPDLRQAAAERRIGTTHQRRRRQVRAGVHTGRLADRVYRRAHRGGRFRVLGYLDRPGARRPADTVPAQRVWSRLDRRAPGALFRDHDRGRQSHGDRDRDGHPGRRAGDLFSAARGRDGALRLPVAGSQIGSRR